MNMKDRKPIILCAGEHGRAVVFGWVDSDPVAGEPVTLYDARMIIYWGGRRGLFSVAVDGPHPDSRLSPAVPTTTTTVWRQKIDVTEDAAKKLRDFQ